MEILFRLDEAKIFVLGVYSFSLNYQPLITLLLLL